MISIDLLCRPQTKSTKKPTEPVSQKPSECYILRLKIDLKQFYALARLKFLFKWVSLFRKEKAPSVINFIQQALLDEFSNNL